MNENIINLELKNINSKFSSSFPFCNYWY